MTPAIGRLKNRPEFLKVAAAGAKWVTPGLILQVRHRSTASGTGAARTTTGHASDENEVRVGFTVSRKVGNAVRRNRVRRRLRAVAEQLLPDLGRPGCDYVLIGRAGTLDRPYGVLQEDLRTALTRIGTKRTNRPRAVRRARRAVKETEIG